MPDTQSACCILGVCCPPAQRQAALAKLLDALDAEWNEKDKSNDSLGAYLAQRLLADFDLVPKGLGRSIIEAYAPAFREQLSKPT